MNPDIFIAQNPADVDIYDKYYKHKKHLRLTVISIAAFSRARELEINTYFIEDFTGPINGVVTKEFYSNSEYIHSLYDKIKTFKHLFEISSWSIIKSLNRIHLLVRILKQIINCDSFNSIYCTAPFYYSIYNFNRMNIWLFPLLLHHFNNDKKIFTVSLVNGRVISKLRLYSHFYFNTFKSIILQLISKYRVRKFINIELPKGELDVLFDGWGDDIEKTFEYEDSLKDLEKNGFSACHLYYDHRNNFNKIKTKLNLKNQHVINLFEKDIMVSNKISNNFQFIKLSLNISNWINRFSSKSERNVIIRIIYFVNTFISLVNAKHNYREALYFMSLFNIKNYIAADGDNQTFRARMVAARMTGINTYSVVHGYNLYPEPLGFFLGQKIILTGNGKKAALLESSKYNKGRVVLIPRRLKLKTQVNTQIKNTILILFSDSHLNGFDYSAKSIIKFINLSIGLARQKPEKEVILKFHPSLKSVDVNKIINKNIKKMVKNIKNIQINYNQFRSTDFSDIGYIFSTNIISTSMVFGAFNGANVIMLKTPWSNNNQYLVPDSLNGDTYGIYFENVNEGVEKIVAFLSGAKDKNEYNEWIINYFSSKEDDGIQNTFSFFRDELKINIIDK